MDVKKLDLKEKLRWLIGIKYNVVEYNEVKKILDNVFVLRDKGCWIVNNDWSVYSKIGNHSGHRLSYMIWIGVLHQDCRHTCERKGCINPEHLYDGKYNRRKDDDVEGINEVNLIRSDRINHGNRNGQ